MLGDLGLHTLEGFVFAKAVDGTEHSETIGRITVTCGLDARIRSISNRLGEESERHRHNADWCT